MNEGGLRRTSADPPQRSFAIYDPMNIGSVSKTLTTMGAMIALAEAGVSVDDPIAPWLPPTWTVGPGVDQIRFRDLLTQESGFRPASDAVNYGQMQTAVEAGIDLLDYGQYDYENLNFCLFRVLIPYLTGYDWLAPLPLGSTQSLETTKAYVNYMRTNVFEPVGFVAVQATAPNFEPTLYYRYPDFAQQGWDTGYVLENTGAGTWHVSALQLAAVLHAFANTSKIVTTSQRGMMMSGLLGMYTANLTGGTAYHHNGGLDYVGGPYTAAMPAGARSVYYLMPNGVIVTVVYNSVSAATDSPNKIVEDAYESAWVPSGP